MTREQKEYRKRIDLEYPGRSKKALEIHSKLKNLLSDLNELGYEFMQLPNGQTSIRQKRGI